MIVRGAERFAELRAQPHHLVDRQGPSAQPRGQRLAFDQLLGDVEPRLVTKAFDDGLAGLVHRGDARVIEDRGCARFLQKAPARLGIARAFGPHDLQRDIALEHAVAGPVHDAHAARRDGPDDVEMTDRAWLHGITSAPSPRRLCGKKPWR